MTTFTSVDLSQLPLPDVVETISFDDIVAAMLADLVARDTNFTALVESDPAYKIIEVCAYREVIVRQRVNEAAKANMLAYAMDGDLDNLGALEGVQRLTITPADPLNSIPAVMESNTDYRYRITLAPEGFSVAGPMGAYIFHALSASGNVLDASAISPAPCQVTVTLLSRDADGTADAGLIATVQAALSADDVRPLTDQVTVQSAEIVNYQITGTRYTFAGPDSDVVNAASDASLAAYVASAQRLGRTIPLSAIYAALHTQGVQRVELTSPTADLVINDTQAAFCTGITMTYGGVGE